MEEEEQALASVEELSVFGFSLLQAEHHYSRVLAEVEEEQAPIPMEVQAEQQYNLSLHEEHRPVAAERTPEAAVVAMVAAGPGIIDICRAMLTSVHSVHTIRRKTLQLRVNETKQNMLFEGQKVEDDSMPEQHNSVVSFASFTPAANDDEAGPSHTGPMDLTSDGEE